MGGKELMPLAMSLVDDGKSLNDVTIDANVYYEFRDPSERDDPVPSTRPWIRTRSSMEVASWANDDLHGSE